MSFGCGIDAFMCDLAGRRIKQLSGLPFIVLTLDEHSGQAGMDTRLEAFIDMIRLRHLKKAGFGG
jgi:predicted nucleotide-binding protein (sugar kinase/HSP70/actin superfamily)